ncbi:MAG TPA: 16S rRNA (guanine(527)-N(7))-methyltransferase RsmG [Candidatus Avimonas sp.]|nr:16S rRNA (guanine(527)-N(7))-methyltransferase RsmG [Clostridiales bacterium]HOB37006.1 16S rRNA (guanine(527)-N(7))-methyltransferase RsmG [Candidatus Avimonas sp.]HQA15419.1 16S rRNA (guanine(527)-N(7))-methyltransferase RsmG [Candidatus Avimonas sp.]HQD38499.1 16S rRNA (guanine(527)-N(7))-methyltransferase RsmG [Candidatus Avimonas sp.]
MSGSFDRGLLLEQAAAIGITLDEACLDRFELVAETMLEWNEKINLTAIADPREIAVKHFADSLTLAPLLPKRGIALIDVGTGAGYPGIPVALVRPDVRLTLLDSMNKRIVYLKELCRRLELPADLVHGRAELAARDPDLREAFDVAAARAVANLPVLCEYCIPFVKPGGRFISMKGPEGEVEAKSVSRAAAVLGAELSEIRRLQMELDGELMERRLIVFDKTAPTPAKYPRNTAKIKKEPLK